jgi:Ca-activated chloride channel family protein
VTEVKEKMVALFGKLESPALTDVRLELAGGSAVDTVPARIPDVYLGEPVTVALRAGTLPPRVVLRGQLGPDRWERELALQAADAAAGLSVHWARGKIAGLLDTRRAGAPDDAVRRAVLDLALAFHLVSPYTSLIAVDVTPVRPGSEDLHTMALETNLPHGWGYTAVFGMGQGATAGPFHLALGLTALLLATALGAVAHRTRRA